MPTTSETTTAESTTTASSTTSTTTSDATTSTAVTSESTILTSTTMPTTSESTTAESTTTASSTTSTIMSDPTTSTAVTSESTTFTSTTLPTSSETTAPVTTSAITVLSITEIPTTTVVGTETTPITSTTLPTSPSTTTATIPSSTAAQTTTAFQVTTGDLLKTTIAFTSTSSAPATLALSTKTTSSPNMDSETTTALTTTTGIITGLTDIAVFPVVPITSGANTNTSTSPASTIPGHTSIKTTPAETLTSNTTPLNNTTKADSFVTLQSTSSLQPETSNIPKTLPTNVSGAATVTTKLIFSSLSSLPTENLVLVAIRTLFKSRESQLNKSLKIVSLTYQKISETSYAVIFNIILNNISMPEDPELRNSSYVQVQDVVNNALNTLLNEPGKEVFEPKSSNFTRTSNQIDGRMEYIFQDGDAIQPVSFLNQQRLPTTTTVFPETTNGVSVTPSTLISASAVVISKLVFNSSSPVPSEDRVLSAIKTLRNSRESQLNESVKVVNVTYEKISETSYAVVFTFTLVNISVPEDPELRDKTYPQLQDTSNNALNTLLNEPGKQVFKSKPSNFTSTSNQIDGRMDYTFQDGDAIQPVSFLNELRLPTTTTVFPETTTGVSVTPQTSCKSASAVVISKLVFNSSSPVPSEDLVLSAINTLRNSRESQLNESVKVVNVIYQKISETSYAVIFTFTLVNISVPEDPELRDKTYPQLQDTSNNALNTLLNEPGKQVFKSKPSNFTSTSNQIDCRMDYTFQDGEAIQPVSFLNELRLPTTTTVFPETTTGVSVTPSNLISASAVVISKLVFNSSSPVPSEALVLSAIKTLRNSRESQLNESVKVVNVTYEKISETSYAVVFTFTLVNISVPEDPELRDKTYPQLQDTSNNALNTLLNEPGKQVFKSKSSNFTSTSNQIDGRMDYTFQDGEAIQPVSFLNELRLPTTTTVLPEITISFSMTPSNLISGSAVVISKLVFSSSSPVPSEDLVLSTINTLRNSRESQLNASVKVVNVTYEKITTTSYAVIFKFNMSNISMSKDPELRNGTYLQAQGVVNNALNTLLNEPGTTTLNPKSTNFISTSNLIDGRMEYTFQDGDAIQPVSFLNELRSPTVLTTTSTLITTPPIVRGRALISIRLVFVTLGPLPNPDKVLEVVNNMLKTRLTTKQDTTTQDLSDSVNFANVTYTKINETAYALNFGFEISNITMSGKLELRNGTHLVIQDSINSLLGKILLSNSSAPLIKFQAADFTGNSTVIQANVEYVFSPSDITQPSIFVQQLLQLAEASSLTTTSPPILTRRAIIKIRLEFITLGPRPSEKSVLDVVKSMLASNLTTKQTVRTVSVSDPVTVDNVIYLGINDTAYALIFTFEINKVSLTELKRNETYQVIQKKINDLVIKILKDPSVNLLIPAEFKDDLTVIEANVMFVFSQHDSNSAAGYLVSTLFKVFTTPVPTTMNTTISNNGTNVAWIVAIIVPCAIVIGLVPCWILLCCLLCGCCAAIRRRWHRRRSYNVQYTTRNSLF
ncbi:mucin-2 [Onychostoma macrolepis]|uniref:mucin-2 n=1 Tax=Onychostoma macrolepis TaxID=369639 RepID=UPI00272B4C7A|nr:mucin-2 [Onychostoma macrolepis]